MTEHPDHYSLTSKVSVRCMDAIRYCGVIVDREGKNCTFALDQMERGLTEAIEALAAYRAKQLADIER